MPKNLVIIHYLHYLHRQYSDAALEHFKSINRVRNQLNITQCDGNCTSDVQRRRRRTAEGSGCVVLFTG